MSGKRPTNQAGNRPANNTNRANNAANGSANNSANNPQNNGSNGSINNSGNRPTNGSDNGAANTSGNQPDDMSNGILGRRCRCRAPFCMVESFKYESLKKLIFAKLSLEHPEEGLRVKFNAMFSEYTARVNKLTDEEFAKEFPCFKRNAKDPLVWKTEQAVWRRCFGEFETFPSAGPLKGEEFKQEYISLQDLIWARILHEGAKAHSLSSYEKDTYDKKAKDCLEGAKGSYFNHTPAHQLYKSEFHLWGWYFPNELFPAVDPETRKKPPARPDTPPPPPPPPTPPPPPPRRQAPQYHDSGGCCVVM